MKHTTWSALMFAAAVTAAVPSNSDAKQYVAHGTIVSGPAAVRVWVEGGDVFPDYNHVTLWVRPDRDCYTSLFLVDTAGFIHVLNTGDYDDGWLNGGRAYGYRACDLGLDRLDGRGIAYVFAVGSPVPFDYSYYGASVRVGDRCSHCEPVYATYRGNLAAPYEAMRPHVRYKQTARYDANVHHIVRGGGRYEPIREQNVRVKARETVRVVSTSRDTRSPQFAKSRTDVRVIARETAQRNETALVAYQDRGQKHSSLAQAREKGARKKVRQAK